ncbi:MAG TPA: putative Ig domain-containing protein [Casimicrobiaceae bacterium]
MRGVIATLAAVAAALVATTATAQSVQLQHVTLIGDSVSDSIRVSANAARVVRQGVDMDLETAPCRRVEGIGCPIDGKRPASAVELIRSMGADIGPNVVVAVGYNDFEDQYAGNVDDALAALKEAGVRHVWWLTLRAAHHPYIPMNADLEAAAQDHPELTIIDWNVYSRSHPDWFQADGIHLKNAGSLQMAALVHKTLVGAGVATPPPRVLTKALPLAHRGKAYRARLRAASGDAPYAWSLLERAPAGVHLESSGLVGGTPRARPGRYTFNVRVEDAAGSVVTRRLTLRIS